MTTPHTIASALADAGYPTRSVTCYFDPERVQQGGRIYLHGVTSSVRMDGNGRMAVGTMATDTTLDLEKVLTCLARARPVRDWTVADAIRVLAHHGYPPARPILDADTRARTGWLTVGPDQRVHIEGDNVFTLHRRRFGGTWEAVGTSNFAVLLQNIKKPAAVPMIVVAEDDDGEGDGLPCAHRRGKTALPKMPEDLAMTIRELAMRLKADGYDHRQWNEASDGAAGRIELKCGLTVRRERSRKLVAISRAGAEWSTYTYSNLLGKLVEFNARPERDVTAGPRLGDGYDVVDHPTAILRTTVQAVEAGGQEVHVRVTPEAWEETPLNDDHTKTFRLAAAGIHVARRKPAEVPISRDELRFLRGNQAVLVGAVGEPESFYAVLKDVPIPDPDILAKLSSPGRARAFLTVDQALLLAIDGRLPDVRLVDHLNRDVRAVTLVMDC